MDLFTFLGKHPLMAAALVVLVILFISNEISIWTRKFKIATPKVLVDLMNQNNAVVLDIREAKEFKMGHIVDAKNVPLSTLEGKKEQLESYKEGPTVICCALGQQSVRIAASMAKEGFDKIYVLKGGISAWQQENYPLARNK